MNNNELIEKYLNGELTSDELAYFKSKLENDKELAKELQLVTDVNEFLNNDEPKFKNELKEMIISYKKSKRKTISLKNALKPMSLAASIIILVGLSFYFYYNFNNSNAQLYKKYYHPYEYSVVERSGKNTGINESLAQAFNEYNLQNYDKALVLFNKSIANDTANQVVEFLIANCYMQTNQTDSAVITLKHLLSYRNNLLSKNISWYLGLCYLKNQENEKAKQMFKYLAEHNNFYAEKAKSLLRKIK
ncbi:MAG: tetratricopeptide repeat protein [Chlorobi bacterium]|nr:tetratricopeptide repeat protein [Chlorobiota bacterium]